MAILLTGVQASGDVGNVFVLFEIAGAAIGAAARSGSVAASAKRAASVLAQAGAGSVAAHAMSGSVAAAKITLVVE